MTDRADEPVRWRVLLDPPASGAWNMAVDEGLARELQPGTGVLRFYEWSPPTVSFGRNQPAVNRYDIDRATARGIEFVRRPTGGRAVLHDRELTYAVVVSDTAFGGPRRIYERVQAALARGLTALGVDAIEQAAERGRKAPKPSTEPCFGEALPGEVTLAGHKVVGSAQARIAGAVLQHGSILLRNDQSQLDELTSGSSENPSQRPATLEQAGVVVAPAVVAQHMLRAFEESVPGPFEESSMTADERNRAEQLLQQFENYNWTWRR